MIIMLNPIDPTYWLRDLKPFPNFDMTRNVEPGTQGAQFAQSVIAAPPAANREKLRLCKTRVCKLVFCEYIMHRKKKKLNRV